MKKFLNSFVSFMLIPTIILLLMEFFIYYQKNNIFSEEMLSRKYVNVSNDYKWITKVKPGKKILLLGSSSVRYGLSCSQLKKMANDSISFVNLAMNARNPMGTYFILKQNDLTDVKSIYFGLDPWIFVKNYYVYTDTYLFLDFDFITFLKYTKENRISFFASRLKEVFKYLYLYMNFKHNRSENFEIPSDYGSAKLQGKPTNFDNPVKESFKTDKYGWSDLQFIYFNKILNLCRERHIDFYVFLPPKRSDFSRDYKANCSIINDEFLYNLVKFNFTAPIFGKFDQLDTLGDFELFADPYHLNSVGQEIYTKIFFNMINDKIKNNINNQYLWFNNINNDLKTK